MLLVVTWTRGLQPTWAYQYLSELFILLRYINRNTPYGEFATCKPLPPQNLFVGRKQRESYHLFASDSQINGPLFRLKFSLPIILRDIWSQRASCSFKVYLVISEPVALILLELITALLASLHGPGIFYLIIFFMFSFVLTRTLQGLWYA